MRLLRYALKNVGPDASDAAGALARFAAFFAEHLDSDEAVGWLTVSQSADAPIVTTLATLFPDDATGFIVGAAAKTAREARAALPAGAGV